MPAVSRFMIKTAFIWMLFALVLGVIIYLPVENRYSVFLLPVFYHSITLGWITQLIFGIAYWFLPKYSKEKPRGSEKIAWATYGTVNLGMLLRVIGEPLVAINGGTALGREILFASILFLSVSGILFVINSWKRAET